MDTGDVLTVDGQSYIISELPDQIKELLRLYKICEHNERKAKDEAFMASAAARAIGSEIESRIRRLRDSSGST